MALEGLYVAGCWAILAFAAVTFPMLFWVTAPYGGRHARPGWGPTLPAKLGWVVMELPSPLCFALAFARGDHAGEALPLFFLGLYQLHYLQRTFVFPLLMRGRGKRNPFGPVVMAFVFNIVNGTINGFAVGEIATYGSAWLADPRFWIGTALFLAGYAANLHSDATLRGLRKPGESGYRIPHGGLFRWVSSPNYLGEIVEWTGWAIATWTFAGLAFAVFTFANLAPRAVSNHRWYQQEFPDYPKERCALVPGIW